MNVRCKSGVVHHLIHFLSIVQSATRRVPEVFVGAVDVRSAPVLPVALVTAGLVRLDAVPLPEKGFTDWDIDSGDAFEPLEDTRILCR